MEQSASTFQFEHLALKWRGWMLLPCFVHILPLGTCSAAGRGRDKTLRHASCENPHATLTGGWNYLKQDSSLFQNSHAIHIQSFVWDRAPFTGFTVLRQASFDVGGTVITQVVQALADVHHNFPMGKNGFPFHWHTPKIPTYNAQPNFLTTNVAFFYIPTYNAHPQL